MEAIEITKEAALSNIRKALNAFKGTREEHYWLDLSFEKISSLEEVPQLAAPDKTQ